MKLTLIIALLCLIKGIKLEESDDSDESNGDVPEHKFDIQKTTFKTGKRKGDEKITIGLQMGPYYFRKKTWNGNVSSLFVYIVRSTKIKLLLKHKCLTEKL